MGIEEMSTLPRRDVDKAVKQIDTFIQVVDFIGKRLKCIKTMPNKNAFYSGQEALAVELMELVKNGVM